MGPILQSPLFALIFKAIIIHSAVIQNKGRYIIIEAKGGPCTCEMSHSLEMQIAMLSTSSIPTLLMLGMLRKITPIPSLTRKQFWITLLQNSQTTAAALVCPQVQVGCKGFPSVLMEVVHYGTTTCLIIIISNNWILNLPHFDGLLRCKNTVESQFFIQGLIPFKKVA